MSKEARNQKVILPFQSRLFENPGEAVIAEISEFQAASWNLGEESMNFHSAIISSPQSAALIQSLKNLNAFAVNNGEVTPRIYKRPKSDPHRKQFTLAILGIHDAPGKPPIALANLAIQMRQQDINQSPWTYSVHIENIFMSRSKEPASHMLCAAIADIIYDEMLHIDTQARDQGVSVKMLLNITHNALDQMIKKFTQKLRPEMESVRYLINRSDNTPLQPGVFIQQSRV